MINDWKLICILWRKDVGENGVVPACDIAINYKKNSVMNGGFAFLEDDGESEGVKTIKAFIEDKFEEVFVPYADCIQNCDNKAFNELQNKYDLDFENLEIDKISAYDLWHSIFLVKYKDKLIIDDKTDVYEMFAYSLDWTDINKPLAQFD